MIESTGSMGRTATYAEELFVAEIERLRTALRGIASCSTCAACRGAAEIALGDVPQSEQRLSTEGDQSV